MQLPNKYGGTYTVTLIPGDGIGAEITNSVKEIFEACNVPVEWEQYDVSGETKGGEDLFRQAMDSLKRNKVGLKGESEMWKPVDTAWGIHASLRDRSGCWDGAKVNDEGE